MGASLVIWEPQELFRENPLLPAGGSVGGWGPCDTPDVRWPPPWSWLAFESLQQSLNSALSGKCSEQQLERGFFESPLWKPQLGFWPFGKRPCELARVRHFHHSIFKVTFVLVFEIYKICTCYKALILRRRYRELSFEDTDSYFSFH